MSVEPKVFLLIGEIRHLLKPSPWPFVVSWCALREIVSLLFWFKFYTRIFLILNRFLLFLVVFAWWRDVSRESYSGEYSFSTTDGLKVGIILFITREVCFFGAFFWTFFHVAFCPTQDLGSVWPPFGIIVFNPFGGPLLNTLILLGSGVSVTWCHHNLVGNGSWKVPLSLTIFLGVYFTFLQGIEYNLARFTIRDSIYGSTFFIATGFHGIHVLVGTCFLTICLLRSTFLSITCWNHLGLYLAIWYWHFVDVVWLFLFSCFYWWGY